MATPIRGPCSLYLGLSSLSATMTITRFAVGPRRDGASLTLRPIPFCDRITPAADGLRATSLFRPRSPQVYCNAARTHRLAVRLPAQTCGTEAEQIGHRQTGDA